MPSTEVVKEVDRNGYIPLGSFHHPRWLSAIPKSQFVRVRRNCASIEDFDKQAKVLFDRFVEKGYTPWELNKTLSAVRSINRDDLFKKKVVTERDFAIAFMTGYTRQYRQVEKIISK